MTANAQQVATLNEPVTVEAGEYATFTAPSSGTLEATFDPGFYTMFYPSALFTGLDGDEGSGEVPMQVLEENAGAAVKVSWEVAASKTYYLVFNLMTGGQTFTLTMDGTGGGGNEGGDNGDGGDSGDTPGLQELKMDTPYYCGKDNILEGYFTAATNGTLISNQYGSSDPYFYSDPEFTLVIPADNTGSDPYYLKRKSE